MKQKLGRKSLTALALAVACAAASVYFFSSGELTPTLVLLALTVVFLSVFVVLRKGKEMLEGIRETFLRV
ncbi:MAG: hypothetical protein ABIH99_04660 [Candidatus Micrarchaeota archaeon]